MTQEFGDMTRTSSSTQMADSLDQREVRSVVLSGDYRLADTCRVQPGRR